MSPQKFRKRPVEVEAMRYTPESSLALREWMGPQTYVIHDGEVLVIETFEGAMRANVGDWIIKGIRGEFYPCKPDIFDATYELAGVTA